MINKTGSYPKEEFLQAWKSKIYPDHGWGGKDGQSTDNIFLAKFEDAKAKGKSLLNGDMQKIGSQIIANPAKGIPVIVFNSLSWQRTNPVTFAIHFTAKVRSVNVYNAQGKLLPSQIAHVVADKDGYVQMPVSTSFPKVYLLL